MNNEFLSAAAGDQPLLSGPIEKTVSVWDPLVRVFHWSLVLAFLVAMVSGDEFLDLHLFAGYVIGGLLGVRLLWGVIGSRHARFGDFVHKPATVWQYMKSLRKGHPRRYLGHNPAGGAMVLALLLSLLVTVVTGVAYYGADEMSGPLATSMSGLGSFWSGALEEIHEFFANLTVVLVAAHVGGVILASLQHKENLVAAMVNGRKREADADDVA